MKHAYVFPGQGAQFVGMGKDLYDNVPAAKELFEKANEILGFSITDIMFAGTDEQLKQTKVTQPAIFLHSVILAKSLGAEFAPEMVAGHSLGEFSALVAAGALGFEDGLTLVSKRAMAMQKACEQNPSTMAAIIGLPDNVVEEICASIPGVVVPANYNCPGQLVIGGEQAAVDKAAALAKELGAKRCLPLKVSGPFHTSLLAPAGDALREKFRETAFGAMRIPVLFNCLGREMGPEDTIPALLGKQVQTSVYMEDTIRRLAELGVDTIVEIGPGKALIGFVKKTAPAIKTYAVETCADLDALSAALKG